MKYSVYDSSPSFVIGLYLSLTPILIINNSSCVYATAEERKNNRTSMTEAAAFRNTCNHDGYD